MAHMPSCYAQVRWMALDEHPLEGAACWTTSGSPSAWRSSVQVHERSLILARTPDPWSFWLGIIQRASHELAPIVRFKNAIPLFEGGTSDIRQGGELDAETWPRAVRSVLQRNPGLGGLLDVITNRLELPEREPARASS